MISTVRIDSRVGLPGSSKRGQCPKVGELGIITRSDSTFHSHNRESGSCVPRNCATIGVHPSHFSPTSVQFKSEINGAFLCKRHQKQHLEFCTAYLRTRGSGVRVSPGAPVTQKTSLQKEISNDTGSLALLTANCLDEADLTASAQRHEGDAAAKEF